MSSIRPLRSWSDWGHLRPFLPAHSRMRIAFLGVTSFLGSLAESGVLIIVALTADTLIRGSNHVQVAFFSVSQSTAAIAALGLVAIRVVLIIWSSQIAAHFAVEVMMNAQGQVLRSYFNTSYNIRSSRSMGDLTTVMVSHGRITGDLANGFAGLTTSLCGLIAFGGTSLVVNPLATMGIAVIGGILVGLLYPLRQRHYSSAEQYAELSRTLAAQMTQVESLQREVEVFHVSDVVLNRIDQELHLNALPLRRVRFLSSTIPLIFQSALLGAAVLSLLLITNVAPGADLAALGAVVLLLIRSMTSSQQVVTANQRIAESGAYARGIVSLIRLFGTEQDEWGTKNPDSLTPLSLRNLSFSYDGHTPVLKDMDVVFNSGELVGIVGPSGAGNSTLVELILRLRRPTSGSIMVGTVPAHDVDAAVFGERVAFVPQRAVLVNGTVAENVSFFRDMGPERIRSALRAAHLEDEIDALPDGMNTRLGPDERALSGGQQQRLTIARALAGDPEILILDEPTSALDAVSEAAIRKTLEDLPSRCLAIIVAHRYSTLRSCDRILLIENGLITADATPAEVADNSAFFRTMVGDST
ncbi:MAG: ABC transporter ATP-binding protein [Microthrixaceae bacterium]|nr:ABC transporter ATP-binding protein [Microthrixaceae bacterium]